MTSGLWKRSYSKRNTTQIALKAVEAAYLIESPWTWNLELQSQSSTGEGARLRAPVASTDENQIIPEHGTWCKHNIQRSTPHTPCPPPACADLHRHCDSAPLACPWVRPVPDAFTLSEKEKANRTKEKKSLALLFPFSPEVKTLDIMRLSKL